MKGLNILFLIQALVLGWLGAIAKAELPKNGLENPNANIINKAKFISNYVSALTKGNVSEEHLMQLLQQGTILDSAEGQLDLASEAEKPKSKNPKPKK